MVSGIETKERKFAYAEVSNFEHGGCQNVSMKTFVAAKLSCEKSKPF